MLSRLKLVENLRFALVGWIGGIVSVLILGFLWPTIFPAILAPGHYYGANSPSLVFVTGFALLISAPFAWIGGFIGSRLPSEGGRAEQSVVAFLIGAIVVLPFACYGMWFFTGF